MCKIYFFVQQMSYTASIVILTVIAVERFLAIVYPLKNKQFTTLSRLRMIIVIIWAVAATYSIPQLIIYDQVSLDTDHFCIPVVEFNVGAYVTFNFLFLYMCPLLVIASLYGRICWTMWCSTRNQSAFRPDKSNGDQCKSARDIPGRTANGSVCYKGYTPHQVANSLQPRSVNTRVSFDSSSYEMSTIRDASSSSERVCGGTCSGRQSSNTSTTCCLRIAKKPQCKTRSKAGCGSHRGSGRHSSTVRARRRVIRLLVAVVISFALLVLPYQVRVLRQFWSPPREKTPAESLFPTITFILLFLNSGLNPVLYALLSENFRKCMIEVVFCRQTTQGAIHSQGETRTVVGHI